MVFPGYLLVFSVRFVEEFLHDFSLNFFFFRVSAKVSSISYPRFSAGIHRMISPGVYIEVCWKFSYDLSASYF